MGNSTKQDHFVYTVRGVLASDTFHHKTHLLLLPGGLFSSSVSPPSSFVQGQEKTTACNNYRPMWVN